MDMSRGDVIGFCTRNDMTRGVCGVPWMDIPTDLRQINPSLRPVDSSHISGSVAPASWHIRDSHTCPQQRYSRHRIWHTKQRRGLRRSRLLTVRTSLPSATSRLNLNLHCDTSFSSLLGPAPQCLGKAYAFRSFLEYLYILAYLHTGFLRISPLIFTVAPTLRRPSPSHSNSVALSAICPGDIWREKPCLDRYYRQPSSLTPRKQATKRKWSLILGAMTSSALTLPRAHTAIPTLPYVLAQQLHFTSSPSHHPRLTIHGHILALRRAQYP